MAAIEKVCEVCGEHVGYNKARLLTCRNSIQVCTTCLPLFKGKPYTFQWEDRVDHYPWNNMTNFRLIVSNVPGTVSGEYWRWTNNKSLTRKKLCKILGISKLYD